MVVIVIKYYKPSLNEYTGQLWVSCSQCYRHVVLCTRVRQFTKVMCFRLVAGSDFFIGRKLYTAVAVQYKQYITSGKNYRMEHVKVRNEKNGKLQIEQT